METEARARRGAIDWVFAGAAALALLAAAGWLRALGVPYLVACAGATAVLVPLALRRPRRASRLALAAASLAFVASGALAERAVATLEQDWPRVEREAVAAGEARLARELAGATSALQRAAREALDAPAEADAAFAHVGAVRAAEETMPGAEWALVLWEGDAPLAWSGTVRSAVERPAEPFAVSANAFYLVLHVSETRGARQAVASLVVHADPPADRLTTALDERVVAGAGLRRIAFLPPGDTARRGFAFAPAGRVLFTAAAVPEETGAARLALEERARVRGGLLFALVLAAFLAALWPRPASLGRRLGSLAVALAAVALVPLNAYSNASPLFDPLYYYASLGGPFTASAGALGLTSGLALLGLFAVLRWRVRMPSRALGAFVVLAIAALGPFLLRDLARGITPPRWGVSTGLWLAWEITIFLAACAVLLAGASAGQVALGGRRGLHPIVAPALAALAALLAQPLADGTGRLPGWYAAMWIVAMGALALTRRTRALLFTAATVAGLGAATLVWGSIARKRVDLAARDVAGLTTPDPYARTLLERLAADLGGDGAPATRAGLLKRFTGSALAAAGYPVMLEARDSAGRVLAQLVTAPGVGAGAERVLDQLAREALGAGETIVREREGAPTAQLVAAVPGDGGGATTIAVASRTRLLPDDPFAALYGLASPQPAEAPYRLTIYPEGEATAREPEGRWRREGLELHGNWTLQLAGGATRAHAEVELRSLDAMIQRGVLVVLLDLAIVWLLWTASALADGGLPRWLRLRRARQTRSFRTRLTVALFAFFVIPAVAFAIWSYRRLQADDVESRQLLVSEALRGLTIGDVIDPDAASQRAQAPLFVYAGGELRTATDALLEQLAPIGRLAPARVYRTLVLGDERMATREEPIGPAGTLVGYRAVTGASVPAIVAAPARADDLSLDRRRRDLGVLVLFATALGALAALGLSGLAARELARPIGVLREAALALAAGRPAPLPDRAPPGEFVPVFSAFRRMAEDLAASRSALEEAQRRTAAVLRNVASGVVAVDAELNIALGNPRAEALLACPLEPGASVACLQAPDLQARLEEFVRGGAIEEEFDAELRGRQLRARMTRLARGGAVLTLDDVTELAHAQRVLAWGEMARQVAHEIKNPLTPIRLGVQMLRRAHHDRRADFDRILEQNVGRILDEIDRLDEIARTFSRYGTAPAERPKAEPIDVAAVLRDVVALERMGEEAVQWGVEGADAPALAMARDDELREVLLNLLENARLAGASSVTSRLAREDGRVRIAVQDDGHGMSPEVLPRIFQPHFSTRTSGSGLGLAISRRMIEGWGGTIAATSALGEGTTMTIELLAAERADAPPRA